MFPISLHEMASALGIALAIFVVLYLLTDLISAVASRAYFAEKEKHHKRVIETITKEDSKHE